jgi:cullin 4
MFDIWQAVVSETHDFYRVEADSCMRSMDVPAYLAHVQRRLDEENERIIHYLDSSTRKACDHGFFRCLFPLHH